MTNKTTDHVAPRIFRLGKTARRLGISTVKLRQMVNNGEIRYVRVSGILQFDFDGMVDYFGESEAIKRFGPEPGQEAKP